MKNFQKYTHRHTGEQAKWEDVARMIGLPESIKEDTRIMTQSGEFFVVHDLKPSNSKFPVLLKDRERSMKGNIPLIKNSKIVTYEDGQRVLTPVCS